jgi:tRNA modification GTPase
MKLLTDTIAAIATANGEGSIAIIRVSGEQAITVVDKMFRSRQNLIDATTHTIHYGHIVHPATHELIEEVLVALMRGPRSFTREDVVEIQCHGGTVAAQSILSLLLTCGIRLAEPGEFTKRAFLNGRIDLSQAEAVIDLIRAKSNQAFKIAQRQAEGYFSTEIKKIRYQLLQLIAHLEVNIDYPEHDTPELTIAHIHQECASVTVGIDHLISMSKRGKWLRDGIVTAIVGKPNVGKSSLLNALIRENKAIVTDIPGTTRDIIEEYVILNGIPLKLLDTAGIRESTDRVEQIGVEKSKAAIRDAELIILVLNYHEEINDDERKLLAEVLNRPAILLINKIDLPGKLNISSLREQLTSTQTLIEVSVKEQIGLDRLEQAVRELFFSGQIEVDDLTYASNVRHMHLLQLAKHSLLDAIASSSAGFPIDIVQIDIRESWEQLGFIIGDSVSESLLDQIFSQFCLGK